MDQIVYVLCLVFIVTFLVAFFIKQTQRPNNYPPGPRWLPIIGNIRDVKRSGCSQHVAFTKLAQKYNTNVLGLKLGGELVAVVSSFETVRKVLSSDEYLGRPNNFFLRLRCMGTKCGITATDGSSWLQQRDFVVRHLRNLGFGKKPMEQMINDELTDIMNMLECHQIHMLSPLFSHAALNVLWTMTTGARIPWTDSRLHDLLVLMEERACAFDMAGGTINQLPWLRFIIPEKIGYNLILNINQKLKQFFTETINMHKETWTSDKRNDDMIYAFLTEKQEQDENNELFTDQQLFMIILDLFFGGATTTSSTLNFVFLMMLLHENVQEKAAQLIRTTFDPDKSITYADRIKVPYIEAILMEVERMYTVTAIMGPRRVLKDTVLENYNIPKETTCLLNIHSVHHDARYWGDPEVFRPERFLNENGKIEQNEQHLIIFGLGKRRCIGEILARQCIFLFFVNIIRKYKICPVPGTELPSPVPLPGIILQPVKYSVQLVTRNHKS